MTEAIFPLLGVFLVELIALPLFALAAKSCLILFEGNDGTTRIQGLGHQFLVIACSSILPIAWLLSAALHQAETGKSVLACLNEHDKAERCFEAGFFALNLGVVVLVQAWWTLRQGRPVVMSSSPRARLVQQRIKALLASRNMRTVASSVIVTEDADATIGTQGWLRPQVFIGADFAERLSDEMLAGAMAHEREHVHARDPLRYFLLQVALALNPVGRFLLEPHVARWYAVREAQCDRQAVLGGSSPLSLADAIVQAARPTASLTPALGPSDTAVLKYRIEMLLAFSERRPGHDSARARPALSSALALVVLALLLPHQAGTGPLDALHVAAEHVLTLM